MFSCFVFLMLYFAVIAIGYITAIIIAVISQWAGSYGERKTDKDIIRHNQVLPVQSHKHYPSNLSRRSLVNKIQTNDYDDRSGGVTKLRAPMHVVYASKTTPSNDGESFKTYQPREDPKLYYQSEAYLKEINGQSIIKDKEVTHIYPGWEVVRAGEEYRIPKHLLRSGEEYRKPKLCVRCPHDRTLIAKVGMEKVILHSPLLKTCAGRKAPKSVRLVHMHGPKFGTLLHHGSYVLVGRLMHNNETLRLCKIKVHVIIQSCPTPKHLMSHCFDRNSSCNFTCRDKSLELIGESALVCNEELKWEGRLPVCRARNWCKPLTPPDVGKVSCRGATTDYSRVGLSEGTRCRIRCPVNWRWFPTSVAVCRRGTWTNVLQCRPNRVLY